MKILRLIILTATIAGSTWSAWPQGGGVVDSPTCWRLVNGPERGLILRGQGRQIFDLGLGAFGVIEDPEKCKCIHYHGNLFGESEPKSSCGWGCVIQVPCPPDSVSEAASDLWNTIEFIYYEVDGDLGDKLADIYETMEFYADQGCYGVVDALADAFSDELYGYFLQFGYATLFNPLVQNLAEYVNARLEALTNPPFFPVVAPNTARILWQVASGSRGRLLDPGPRITLAVGQMLTLQMLAEAGLLNHLFLWQYKWKGMSEGEIPNGAAVAILANYITLVAYTQTSLRLTGLVRTQDGRFFRDAILINWVGSTAE